MSRKITIGFSPCPNDTFIFDALVNYRIESPFTFQAVMADVEELNVMALKGMLDVTKLSFSAYFNVAEQYYLMRSGSALGKGVGPLLIAKNASIEKPVSEWKVALPGKLTTAHLLFSLAYPGIQDKQFMLFSDIENAVLNGEVDAGVIIHENRFTYRDKGLECIQDLGNYWEERFKMPVPLGGIAAKRELPIAELHTIEELIRKSVDYAFKNPSASREFVADHAQEMSEEVRKKHIQTYVNDYSLDLGQEGERAILELGETATTLFGLQKASKNIFLPPAN